MINLNAITQATLKKEPFKYAIIEHFFSKAYAQDLLNQLPSNGNYKSMRTEGSDKTYNVVNNILLALGDDSWNKASEPSMLWIDCIGQLYSLQYRQALGALLDVDLTNSPMEITLKRYRYQDYISAHTDKKSVRATHMIFLNSSWNESWGGLLHFQNDSKEDFETFIPCRTTSVAFVRSENSWHRVCPMNHPDKERIAIQVAFWNEVDRKIAPGRKIEAIHD